MSILSDEAPVLSFESAYQQISLEAFVVPNMLQSLKSTIPSLIEGLKQNAQALLGINTENNEEVIKLQDKDKKLIQSLKTIGFMHFDKELVSVPENFVGNLLHYTKTLTKITETVNIYQKEMFTQYQVILSAIVTNKSEKVSLQDHTKLFKNIHNQRESFLKEIKKYFPRETHQSKAQLGKVISRTEELAELIYSVEHLNHILTTISLTDISSNVNKCVSTLQILTGQVEDANSGIISSNTAMNISTGAYECGKFVEFISILYFDILTLTTSVSSIVEYLRKVTNTK